MLGGCAQQSAEPTEPHTEPHNFSDPTPSIATEIIPDKSYYLPSENAVVEVVFENVGLSTATIRPFPPNISIVSLNEYYTIRSFTEGTGELLLAPGEKKIYEFTWNQEDDSGQRVPPGMSYKIRLQFTKELTSKPEYPQESITYQRVFIQYPQGAMEKTIDVCQTQTAEDLPLTVRGEELLADITITLERAELSAEGAEFTVFVSWQEQTDLDNEKELGDFLRSRSWGRTGAQYLADGITYSCYEHRVSRLQDGIRNRFKGEPIPSDTDELVFVLPRLSEYWRGWEGPWEFHVPLE
jgi:hypothetical protein